MRPWYIQDRLIDWCRETFLSKNQDTPYANLIFRALRSDFIDIDASDEAIHLLYILSCRLESKPISILDIVLSRDNWKKSDDKFIVFIEDGYKSFQYEEFLENPKLIYHPEDFAILKVSESIWDWELWRYNIYGKLYIKNS